MTGILVLVILIMGASLFFVLDANKNLNEKVNTLSYEIHEKEDELKRLDRKLEKQESKTDELQTTVDSYKANMEIMEEAITEYEGLLDEYSVEVSKLNLKLVEEQQSKIPTGYYDVQEYKYENSVKGLNEFLNFKFELPVNYEMNVFDCSESSAYLEWMLEKYGFETQIAVGRAPFDKSVYHAWVLVSTADGYITAIEATTLTGDADKWIEVASNILDNTGRGIIYYDEYDAVSVDYYENYEDLYDTIHEAVQDNSLEEWNWWHGIWGFQ